MRTVRAACVSAALGWAAVTVAPAAGAQAGAPLLVQERTVHVRVEEPDAAAQKILTVARELGGELRGQAALRIQIHLPEAKVDALLRELGRLGEITSKSGNARGVSAELADLRADLVTARRTKQRLRELERLSQGVDDSLALERRLGEVDARIARLRAAELALERRSHWVEMQVVLERTTSVEHVPTPRLPFPWLNQLGLAALQAPPGPPPPEERPIAGNVDLGFGLEGRMITDRPDPAGDSRAILLGFHSRAARTDPVGFAMGVDLAAGGLNGFAWEAAMMGGLGVSIASVSTIGLVGGIAADGWTGGRVPAGVLVPAELFFTIEVGDAARFVYFAQPRWALTPGSRDDGTRSDSFVDELRLGGSLLLPFVLGEDELDDGGLRLGFVYGEQLGVKTYTAQLGVGWGLVDH